MNSVCISGRISGPLELRHTKDGTAVTSFQVLVARPRVKDTTDLINCIAWRSSAEFVTNNFKTGDIIEITGTIVAWDKNMPDGSTQKVMEVVCNTASWIKPGRFAVAPAEEKPQLVAEPHSISSHTSWAQDEIRPIARAEADDFPF